MRVGRAWGGPAHQLRRSVLRRRKRLRLVVALRPSCAAAGVEVELACAAQMGVE